MYLKKTRLNACIPKQLITILLCLSIFVEPIVNQTTFAVKPGEDGTQASANVETVVGETLSGQEKESSATDVSTEQKGAGELCKDTSEEDAKPQTDTRRPEESVAAIPEPQKSDEEDKASEHTPDVSKGTETPIQTSGSDSIDIEGKSEQNAVETVDTSEPAKEPVDQASTEKPSSNQANLLKVHFIDVWQGDSILIQQDCSSVLIDGGDAAYGSRVVSYLQQHGVEYLDLVVCTHPHDDHILGLYDVLESFPVKSFLMPGVVVATKGYRKIMSTITRKKINFSVPIIGQKICLGKVELEIIFVGSDTSNINNSSIILRLSFGERSFLFTGDAETPVEQCLVYKKMALRTDVLKVGHHGSNTSTCIQFLSKVRPTYAIISVGRGNQFDHPSEDVLNRLSKCGVQTFRTDRNSTIIASSDGEQLSFDKQAINTDAIAKSKEEFPYRVIANTQTRKFHLPKCGFLPHTSKRRDFLDRDEAIKYGYVPCGKCSP